MHDAKYSCRCNWSVGFVLQVGKLRGLLSIKAYDTK